MDSTTTLDEDLEPEISHRGKTNGMDFAETGSISEPPGPAVDSAPHASSTMRTIASSNPAAATEVPLAYSVSDEAFQKRFPKIPLEVMDSIRNEFETFIGARGISPDSPEYARRWKIAGPTALERMRTQFGWAAVAEFERDRLLQAASTAPDRPE